MPKGLPKCRGHLRSTCISSYVYKGQAPRQWPAPLRMLLHASPWGQGTSPSKGQRRLATRSPLLPVGNSVDNTWMPMSPKEPFARPHAPLGGNQHILTRFPAFGLPLHRAQQQKLNSSAPSLSTLYITALRAAQNLWCALQFVLRCAEMSCYNCAEVTCYNQLSFPTTPMSYYRPV